MKDKLLLVWTTDNIEVAKKMVLLYSSVVLPRGYWSEVHLMIWGPSALLLAQNEELQQMLYDVQSTGVRTSACVVCTDSYNVSQKLQELNVELTHTGLDLTSSLKDDSWAVITF